MQSHLVSTAAVAAALLVGGPARAADVLFDFEGQPIGIETPFTLTAGGLSATFAGPPDVDPGAFGLSANFAGPTGFAYRLMNGSFLTIGSAFGASGSALTIAFSAPLSGFSFAFALDDPANASSLSFTTSAGGAGTATGGLTAGYRYPEGLLSYSGAAFTSLTLRSTAIDFQVDDLRAGLAVAAVPEPADALLLALGLPAIAFARRRARRAATP